MGKVAIVIGFILVLILAFRFLMPGVKLPGQVMIEHVIPRSYSSTSVSAPRQHVMEPPYMFDVTNSNTVIHLP
jgi:hypothetical protein